MIRPPPFACLRHKAVQLACRSGCQCVVATHFLKDIAHVLIDLWLHDSVIIHVHIAHLYQWDGIGHKHIPELEHVVAQDILNFFLVFLIGYGPLLFDDARRHQHSQAMRYRRRIHLCLVRNKMRPVASAGDGIYYCAVRRDVGEFFCKEVARLAVEVAVICEKKLANIIIERPFIINH